MSHKPYELAAAARDDIATLYRYGRSAFGKKRASAYVHDIYRRFDLIAAFPLSSRERLEFDPPLRFARHQAHIIVYRLDGEMIQIVRVLHARQELREIFG